MDIAPWIVAGLAAAASLMTGVLKLTQGKKVEDKGMAWAAHYSDNAIRGIGAAEVAGALGLILPAVVLGVLAVVVAIGRIWVAPF